MYNKQCQQPHNTGNLHQLTTNSSCKDEVGNLNLPFCTDELDTAIKKLKKKKSVSTDLVSNEMLINSNTLLRQLLLKLFNQCLLHGTYPWNDSITTPLHKKGCRQNPDNYRAITLGSCLGKLYSSLLLNRLLEFRRQTCPDFPNQLGFRSDAQCSDHLLTLSTIIEKHAKKKGQRVFACFVDFKKAFDTVCRDALLYKLANLGIEGGFFKSIQHMYRNSSTRIKLIQTLSTAIDVTIGTEQGHPMSPELFKIYIRDLSIMLEELTGIQSPEINGFKVTHLMWADDLILLALDRVSLQKQLDCLNKFSTEWELSVNVSKTNVMVFNNSSKILNCSKGFKLGDKVIESVKKYCYLGIQISLNGSFKGAIDELRKKSLRSFFSLKRTIVKAAISTSTMLRLFDSLVKPVAMYGCQIWLPATTALKNMAKLQSRPTSLPHAVSKDAIETTHLKMLKWMLGVHRKTNNNFCYGDTGRLPWAISVLPQCIKYYTRASIASSDPKDSTNLLYHTFQEQKNMDMQWYKTWTALITEAITNYPQEPTSALPDKVYSFWKNLFIEQWGSSLVNQSKMNFYRSIKLGYGESHYLTLKQKDLMTEIAKLRSSSHDLNVEVGRYKPLYNVVHKACRYCCSSDASTLIGLQELPMAEPLILETEAHAITTCPGYHDLRAALSENLLSLIMLQEYAIIMESAHATEFGKFLKLCREKRGRAR